ncbi:50S ribosomal protein L6 [Jeotgalibaca arthritidis]|uniref:Large ribosomal subunit protein uL6 n=1 Tax=Jeotgalibaca arthritidis TaxID=1868794 RepID=A0A6G7K8E2_9LACT|nr:50S ribosomal protein L6 [Jeotgalibaca arthritidis]QII81518.1 50S ribosomal protein L6 [Jeotgalibaca arthritidis]
MSRIGNKQVEIPAGVTIAQDGNTVTVKGPKGELTQTFSELITINVEGNTATFTRANEEKFTKSIHGTTRALFSNMVVGVSEGFKKDLELIGVGYRAQLQGNKLVLNVGYSHPVEFTPEEGVTVEVNANTKITISGYDKEKVGALAANVRAVRPPEPYKGKGIKYSDEIIRRKEGKTGK